MGQLYYLPKKQVNYLLKIVLKLFDKKTGNADDQAFIHRLDQDLQETLKPSEVSQYEGFHCAFGECIFQVFTVNMEQTLAEILPLFKYRVFTPGSYYVKVDPERNIWDAVSLD
ncbi:MAG TPA: hypothetical protein VEC37_04035 [Bacillota bacterium]|nr:hypothetical protein [Bacillota bacterium]